MESKRILPFLFLSATAHLAVFACAVFLHTASDHGSEAKGVSLNAIVVGIYPSGSGDGRGQLNPQGMGPAGSGGKGAGPKSPVKKAGKVVPQIESIASLDYNTALEVPADENTTHKADAPLKEAESSGLFSGDMGDIAGHPSGEGGGDDGMGSGVGQGIGGSGGDGTGDSGTGGGGPCYGPRCGEGYGYGKDIRDYAALIHNSIRRNTFYPLAARKSAMEGRVVTAFLIKADGRISAIKVKVSSGFSILDTAALKIIKKSLPLPAPPAGGLSVEVPLVFSLNDRPKSGG